jgi:hypothetical protein
LNQVQWLVVISRPSRPSGSCAGRWAQIQTTMKCRLCLQERKLSDSHIIPEAFWKPGYDEKHRINAIEHARDYGKVLQKGIREPLLCQSCEEYLNDNYETYSSNLWFTPPILPKNAEKEYYSLSNINYEKFKLFHLSILWRASISSHNMFDKVRLGPYEEIIRQMIVNNDPKSEDNFQIIGTIVTFPGENRILDCLLMSPTKQRVEDKIVYSFFFGGCLWFYAVNLQPINIFERISLKQAGTIILPVRDMTTIKSLHQFFLPKKMRPTRACS